MYYTVGTIFAKLNGLVVYLIENSYNRIWSSSISCTVFSQIFCTSESRISGNGDFLERQTRCQLLAGYLNA